MPEPILVPLDTAIFAINVLPIARLVARQSGGLVHLVSVSHSLVTAGGDPTVSRAHVHRTHRVRETWDRHVEDLGRYFSTELGSHRVRTAFLEGDEPRTALARYARELGVGLIVVGANGLSADGYSRGLNAAADLARESDASVLLVHREVDPADYARDRQFTRVLIALSGTESDDELVGAVCSIDPVGPLRCTLVHVVVASGEWAPIARAESARAYLRGYAAVLEALGHSADIRVIEGHDPSEAITATARSVEADCVIAGLVRRSGSRWAGPGSVTKALFRELALPLLVVPPRAQAERRLG